MSAAAWAGIVGGIGGGVAAVVAVFAWWEARNSAKAARDSADEAAKLTAIEQERREDEREQRHEELGPQMPGEIIATVRDGRATPSLWGSVSFPDKNDYRVRAIALFDGNGSTELGIDHVIHAGQQVDIPIEHWPTGSKQPKTKAIKFQFWPPLDGDGVDVWTCPCRRPVDESTGAAGHWERTCKVVFDPPPAPASASIPAAKPRQGGLFG